MDDRLAGVLSPSKFSGYLSFGLPILNIGPSGTNADYACSNFKAGVSLNAVSEIYGVAELLLNAETQPRLAKTQEKRWNILEKALWTNLLVFCRRDWEKQLGF